MKMSAFCLVTLCMIANGASVVNHINSYKTISPKGNVNGGPHRIIELTLGKAFWLNTTIASVFYE